MTQVIPPLSATVSITLVLEGQKQALGLNVHDLALRALQSLNTHFQHQNIQMVHRKIWLAWAVDYGDSQGAGQAQPRTECRVEAKAVSLVTTRVGSACKLAYRKDPSGLSE